MDADSLLIFILLSCFVWWYACDIYSCVCSSSVHPRIFEPSGRIPWTAFPSLYLLISSRIPTWWSCGHLTPEWHYFRVVKFLCSTGCTCACHEHVQESGAQTPFSLVLSIVWRWVVSFMSHMLYSWVKSPWYPLNRRLNGHQNPSGRFREEKNLITRTGNWTTIRCVCSPQPGC